MEYEQVEYGRKVILEAITGQDINAYHNLLSPEVLLVTHFPYPTSSTDSNVQAIQQWVHLSQQRATATTNAAAASSGSRQRARELLAQRERHRESQQKRYEAFRKRREGHHGGSTEEGSTAGNGAAAAEHAGRPPATDLTSPVSAAHTDGGRKEGAKGGAADADGTRRRDAAATGKSAATTKKNATVGGGASARVPLGVRWYRQQQQQQRGTGSFSQQQQRSPTMPGRVSTTPAQASLAAAAAAATAAAAAAAATAQGGSADGAALAYEDVVDIAEGRLLVSFRFFELLHWVSTGKDVTHIAPVEVDLQLRKDVLQEDEVLPPPPPPTNVAEQYEQLGWQLTERNQPLSCITVIWGCDYLLFRDRIFFDDGLIVTIHRSMLSVPEVVTRSVAPPAWSPQKQAQAQQQQRLSNRRQGGGNAAPSTVMAGRVQSQAVTQAEMTYKAVEAFYGVSASRVNTVNTAWPLLDYSFLDAPEPSALLRLPPASGHVHVGKPPRAAADPRLAQGVFLNQNNDPSMANANPAARTLIKAKNKRGEEEAYEINDNRPRISILQQGGANGGDGDGADGEEWGLGTNGKPKGGRGEPGGAAVRAQRYDAACVRVSGCRLHAKMEQLLPVLRRLVTNSLLTLHTLDLSQNAITALPDLRLLPLQSLKLHDNAIADWRVVEQQIAPLPYLTVLTLHSNPIAEEKEVARGAAGGSTGLSSSAGGAAKHTKGKSSAAAAATGNSAGESPYWKRLLALLLSHPDRVAPLRQVDFVTLTAQDFNLAGAHALFTTGKADVLNRARAMNAGGSRTMVATRPAATRTASTAAGDGM